MIPNLSPWMETMLVNYRHSYHFHRNQSTWYIWNPIAAVLATHEDWNTNGCFRFALPIFASFINQTKWLIGKRRWSPNHARACHTERITEETTTFRCLPRDNYYYSPPAIERDRCFLRFTVCHTVNSRQSRKWLLQKKESDLSVLLDRPLFS